MQGFSAPLFGFLALGGAVLGVHLGNSAIEHINPIHFQGPAVHPRDRGAAIDEHAIGAAEARRPGFASAWGVPAADDCVDCEGLAARDRYATARPAPAAERLFDIPEPEFFMASRVEREETVDWETVERYASFPIEAELYE